MFLGSPNTPRYGYELLRDTGMKSGSLYPILHRFEELGWVDGKMHLSPGNRPPRRVYCLDASGRPGAQAALDRFLEVKDITSAELLAMLA